MEAGLVRIGGKENIGKLYVGYDCRYCDADGPISVAGVSADILGETDGKNTRIEINRQQR